MKIRKGELKYYVKQALMELDEPPFRTGLSKGGWTGMGDPRGSGEENFPATEAEKLGDEIAAAMEGGIRNALMNSMGEEKGLMIYDKYLADVDEEILNIAMRMRDAALDLTGEPEGVTGEEEDLDLQEEW